MAHAAFGASLRLHVHVRRSVGGAGAMLAWVCVGGSVRTLLTPSLSGGLESNFTRFRVRCASFSPDALCVCVCVCVLILIYIIIFNQPSSRSIY